MFKRSMSRYSILCLCLGLLILNASIQRSEAAVAKLAWDPSPDAVSGYKVHYGNSSRNYSRHVDVGKTLSYTLSGLDDSKNYYIATSAYNNSGLESDFSNEIVLAASTSTTPPDTPPDSGSPSSPGTSVPGTSLGTDSGGGGCFIATAAYGSYLAPEVMTLRQFRDDTLLQTGIGTRMVHLYYRLSPPLADFISAHEFLRAAARWALTPVVYAVKYPGILILLGFALFLLNSLRRARSAMLK